MRKVVIIPAAGLIPEELRQEFGDISSALIPINGKPILDIISKEYKEKNYEVVVAGNDDRLKEHCESKYAYVHVPKSNGINDTIRTVLLQIGYKSIDTLAINFADTYIRSAMTYSDSVIFYSDSERGVDRWTSFSLSTHNKITDILDKKQSLSLENVFSGVFLFNDAQEIINEIVAHNSSDHDSFYDNIKNAQSEGYLLDMVKVKLNSSWLDLGHVDTYYQTKKMLALNSRAFNQLSIDSKKGIIKKQSSNEEKLINEIEWFEKLPKELQYLTPRVYNSSKKGKVFIEQEYLYRHSTLSDLYIYGDLPISKWQEILMSLKSIIREFEDWQNPGFLWSSWEKDVINMYVVKTIRRLRDVVKDEKLDHETKYYYMINNRKVFSLNEIIDRLQDDVVEMKLFENSRYGITHGDLCFSNILYDTAVGSIKLIDPRGSFGQNGIWGDLNYDVAKLSHSINGCYDFIVNGAFTLTKNKNPVTTTTLKIPTLTKKHREIGELFNGLFEYDNRQMMIEGLLFLSMIPLHYDKPKQQEAFLVRGLELYTQAINPDGKYPYL